MVKIPILFNADANIRCGLNWAHEMNKKNCAMIVCFGVDANNHFEILTEIQPDELKALMAHCIELLKQYKPVTNGNR